ncbi:MAG: helix-turn-helix transcriptional regulator [Elusimicrobia bacterium]|nr:helix-turn-helix transcriptional regulator [Elusimicrobiota bacterium]
MLPQRDAAGNKLFVKKTIRNRLVVIPDLEKAPIGARIRFLRKRQGLTIPKLERLTGVSHGTISRLERGRAIWNVAAVGKLLAFFGRDLAEAFPAGQDPHDHVFPVSDFASWLRNFRVRKGLQQVELAKLLGMSRVSICRYERNVSRPQDVILRRLKKVFKLNGELDRFLRERD